MGYIEDFVYGATPERKKKTSIKRAGYNRPLTDKTKRITSPMYEKKVVDGKKVDDTTKPQRYKKIRVVDARVRSKKHAPYSRIVYLQGSQKHSKGGVRPAAAYLNRPQEVRMSSEIKKIDPKTGEKKGTGKYKYWRESATDKGWGKAHDQGPGMAVSARQVARDAFTKALPGEILDRAVEKELPNP